MKEEYKTPLTIKEQVKYIHDNKRVRYNDISESKAETILYEHNYINVITPYKHVFARCDANGNTIRDAQGKHIYDRDVEFSEYYNKYQIERLQYVPIYRSIMKFETVFSAIVSYEVIHHYKIDTHTQYCIFIQSMLKTLDTMSRYKQSIIDHMREEVLSFDDKMEKYDDIYIFMDRLSLSELITVYRCCPKKLRKKIFSALDDAGVTFGYTNDGIFEEFLARIVSIRNYVCHFNSLEILINYYDVKSKVIRTSSDRKRYVNIIKKLN